MKISTFSQYRSALAAMRHLSRMDDHPTLAECLRLLEAATAAYAEQLKGEGLSKGRPKQYHRRPAKRY